jgi:hypothetical protein
VRAAFHRGDAETRRKTRRTHGRVGQLGQRGQTARRGVWVSSQKTVARLPWGGSQSTQRHGGKRRERTDEWASSVSEGRQLGVAFGYRVRRRWPVFLGEDRRARRDTGPAGVSQGSPRRKPWEGAGNLEAPAGAEETGVLPPLRGWLCPLSSSHGLRRGLISDAPTGLGISAIENSSVLAARLAGRVPGGG